MTYTCTGLPSHFVGVGSFGVGSGGGAGGVGLGVLGIGGVQAPTAPHVIPTLPLRYPLSFDLSQHVPPFPSGLKEGAYVQNLHCPIVLSEYFAHLAQLQGDGGRRGTSVRKQRCQILAGNVVAVRGRDLPVGWRGCESF